MKKIIIAAMMLVLLITACGQTEDDTLKVGMDLRFFPFTGMDAEGNPAGVEVDIARAIGE